MLELTRKEVVTSLTLSVWHLPYIRFNSTSYVNTISITHFLNLIELDIAIKT